VTRCYRSSTSTRPFSSEPGGGRSRPTQGIVTIATRAYKADGTLVMEFKRTMLIPKRGHSIEDRIEAAKSGEV
jgi:acyl dehydratase